MSATTIQVIEAFPVEETGVGTPSGFTNVPDVPSATSLKNILFFMSLVFRYPGKAVFYETNRLLPVFEDFFNTYAGDVPHPPEEEELQAEYVRLFVNGCGHVPAVPYASCHLDGGVLMGESYHRLVQIMERTGFSLDGAAGDMEDHLAILLEYGSVLVNRLIEAPAAGGSDSNAIFFSLREIIFEYLRPMATPIRAGIASSATFDFYKIAAQALAEFMADAEAIFTQIFGVSALEDHNTGVKT